MAAVVRATTYSLPATNGTNLQAMVSDGAGGSDWGVANFAPGFMFGFHVNYTNASTITVGVSGVTNLCRNSTNTTNISIAGDTAVVISNTGLNGRTVDAAELVHTSYEVYVVHDTTGGGLATGYLMVAVGTDITTTTEFATNNDWDVFRRVWWVRNGLDGNALDLIPFIFGGHGAARVFHYNPNSKNDTRVLSAGSATAWATVTDTSPTGGDGDRQISNMTAPGSHHINVRTAFGDLGGSTNDNSGGAFRPSGNTTSSEETSLWTISPGSGMAAGVFADQAIEIPVPSNRTLQYQLAAADDLFVYMSSFNFGV